MCIPFTDAENSELDQLLGELLSLGQDLASGADSEPVADLPSWESRDEGTPSFSGTHLFLHDSSPLIGFHFHKD